MGCPDLKRADLARSLLSFAFPMPGLKLGIFSVVRNSPRARCGNTCLLYDFPIGLDYSDGLTVHEEANTARRECNAG